MKSWYKLFKLYTKITNHLHSLTRTTAVATFLFESSSANQCDLVTWEASLNRCACFCVTSDQVASSGMAMVSVDRRLMRNSKRDKSGNDMSEPDGNHGQGRWNDNSLSTRCKHKHIQLYWAQGDHAWKWNFLKGWNHLKNKKHTISAKDEHVRAHCPVPNSPPKLTSEYEEHNFLCRKKR